LCDDGIGKCFWMNCHSARTTPEVFASSTDQAAMMPSHAIARQLAIRVLVTHEVASQHVSAVRAGNPAQSLLGNQRGQSPLSTFLVRPRNNPLAY